MWRSLITGLARVTRSIIGSASSSRSSGSGVAPDQAHINIRGREHPPQETVDDQELASLNDELSRAKLVSLKDTEVRGLTRQGSVEVERRDHEEMYSPGDLREIVGEARPLELKYIGVPLDSSVATQHQGEHRGKERSLESHEAEHSYVSGTSRSTEFASATYEERRGDVKRGASRPSSVKSVKVHGLDAMESGVRVPVVTAEHSMSRSRPLLSRSRVREGALDPRETPQHRSVESSQRMTHRDRVSAQEQSRSELTSCKEEPSALMTLNDPTAWGEGVGLHAHLESSNTPPKRRSGKGRRPKSRGARDSREDLKVLNSEPNQNLADFARDRYIDYDEVLTAHIKEMPKRDD